MDGLVGSALSQAGHPSLCVFVLWIRQDRSDSTSAIMAMSVVFFTQLRKQEEVERWKTSESEESSGSMVLPPLVLTDDITGA